MVDASEVQEIQQQMRDRYAQYENLPVPEGESSGAASYPEELPPMLLDPPSDTLLSKTFELSNARPHRCACHCRRRHH
jgi:hypothetical protein